MNESRVSEVSWEVADTMVADDYFCEVEGIVVEVGILSTARPTVWELLVCGVATIKQLLAFI